MPEKKSIICFDVDMTLLNHQTYSIPETALQAVERLRRDHIIALATGRDMDNQLSFMHRDTIKPDAIIHMNGTKVTVGSQVVYDQLMPKEQRKELLNFAKAKNLTLGLSIDGKDYYTNPAWVSYMDKTKWGNQITRDFADPDLLLSMPVRTLTYLGGEEGLELLMERFPRLRFPPFAGKSGADVIMENISKAEGLKTLCRYFDIPLSSTVAFGDSLNDVEIIQAAGLGIAMGNAVAEVKEAADYITLEIERDGILEACRHFGWFAHLLQPV